MAIRTTAPAHLHTVDDTEDTVVEREHRANVAERVVWFIGGVILTLLAFRFVLALLGANPANGFADFIYSTSHPLVSPFFSLFNYNYVDGSGRFELYTLIAIAVYGIIAAGIARLVTINRQ